MKSFQDVKSARLGPDEYDLRFCDKKPPLDLKTAAIESNRCFFCYDAPCIQACPTEIDIPGFIRKISTGNLKGAAVEILSQNIMGGTCARACPVETLCEKACVRNTGEDTPVTIGSLQRYATDWLFEKEIQPFGRAPSTGKKIAIIGAGPAGLSCAHRLSTLGHDVVIYEAKPKAGGLNEYGLATYKMTRNFAQREIDFITSLGGIEIKFEHALGKNISLKQLREDHDAVFIGAGLVGVNAMGIEGEELPHVLDAVDYIAQLRQTENLASLPIGRRVVVVGGGNTAVDIAVQSKLLGAEEVTMVYRRGTDDMSATWKEQELAQKSGVLIKHFAKPVRILGTSQGVTGFEFEKTKEDKDGGLKGTGELFTLDCDMVFKAIGQKLEPSQLGDAGEFLRIENRKIVVDKKRQSSMKGVYAGGDCVNGGDLTVTAVQDGKIAALSIHESLGGNRHG